MRQVFLGWCVLILILALPSGARAEQSSAAIPVCGLIVGKAYKGEVEADTSKPDKYKHCALSCVMTLYCGPGDSMSVGILKEIYDALGFGTPDWKDIEADRAGIRIGLKLISSADFSRGSCYRSCSSTY
jgi:hypothetical protein